MPKFRYFLSLFILLPTLAMAQLPTMYGPTGLITMPTAEILNYKQFNGAFDYQLNLDDTGLSKSFYKFNVGALDNTELGFVGGSEPDEGVFLNFKWGLTSNSGRFPLKMAIGFQNLTSEKQSDFYIVTSKRLATDLGIHGGFKALFADDIDVSFMTGVDYSYSEKISFLSDLSSFEDNLYLVNISSVYKLLHSDINGDLYLKASVQNLFNNAVDGSNLRYLNIGLCYSNVL